MEISKEMRHEIASTIRYKAFAPLRLEAGQSNNRIGKSRDVGDGAGGDGDMRVRGYFTSDSVDEVGDIITRDATRKAVERWRKWGNIRTMHDYPSGRVVAIGDGDGLEWNEIVTVPVERTTQELLEGGVLKAYSVGIIPKEYEVNTDALDNDVDAWSIPLIITDYNLVEISYVDHPANYAAAITSVGTSKSMDGSRKVVFEYKECDMEDKVKGVDEDAIVNVDDGGGVEIDKDTSNSDADAVDGQGDSGDDITLDDILDALAEMQLQIEGILNPMVDSIAKILNMVSPVADQGGDTAEESGDVSNGEILNAIAALSEKVKDFSVLPPGVDRVPIAMTEDAGLDDGGIDILDLDRDARRRKLRELLTERYG